MILILNILYLIPPLIHLFQSLPCFPLNLENPLKSINYLLSRKIILVLCSPLNQLQVVLMMLHSTFLMLTLALLIKLLLLLRVLKLDLSFTIRLCFQRLGRKQWTRRFLLWSSIILGMLFLYPPVSLQLGVNEFIR